MRIRHGTVDDVLPVARHGVTLTEELGEAGDLAGALASASRYLALPDHLFLVAEVDGQLVGGVLAWIKEFVKLSRRDVVVDVVGVRADQRRRGIGAALLEATASWGADKGASGIVMVVPPRSPLTIPPGFKELETWYRKGF